MTRFSTNPPGTVGIEKRIARNVQSVCRVSILAVSRGSITNQNNPMQGLPIVADPNLVKLGEINTSTIFGNPNNLQRVPKLNPRDTWELQYDCSNWFKRLVLSLTVIGCYIHRSYSRVSSYVIENTRLRSIA
jgi:hypothetical protein